MKNKLQCCTYSFIIGFGVLAFSINKTDAKPIIESKPAQIIAADPSFVNLVGEHPQLQLISQDNIWTEGPQAMPDGGVIWSDIKGNKVLHWDEEKGEQVLLKPSQHQNGHALGKDGQLVAASHGKRAIERQSSDGSWHVLVDLYNEQKLNSPNDIIVDKSGDIWFTDPNFGIIQPAEGYGGNSVQGGNHVYRYSPTTNKIFRLDTSLVKAPNGLAFSPDEKKLYITDTDLAYSMIDPALTGVHTNHQIDVYDVNSDKTLTNGRILTKVDPGIPDGIKVDEKGNIWSSSKTGLQIFNAEGKLLGKVIFPQTVSNMSFGINPKTQKPVLFITSHHNVYRMDVGVRGAVMPQ
ncbi:SMP-30/gluconolactonase/LRE family protein [Commensalibacter oyaizuii]|uniref:SMP-30/gluconolactonase/LRE family protein n=1 Tax=Commensalibacter oyaizuii TaxID=3043873 RepID=A0ABT6Q2B3_9PROT|nr:SMP-30/gluconolactonase/LRE family protein [Commensalibacter sp. TBRC 16381]MDI2091245.1 SMP-30/gluconolactonase/LRE family protein [Commensalibacter sp. TBRC 16381]